MAAEKTAGALLTIGEVAATTGVAPHVLRYWEGRLPQLRPVKRAGGRRLYRPEDVAIVRQVQRLIEDDGFTLDGAARALRRGGAKLTPAPAMPHAAHPVADAADIVPQLRAVRDRLVSALN